jgi:NADPH:quinone reductase-like Zn-dependent oxidoreductase
MYAAVVHAFDVPPSYEQFELTGPAGPAEVVVDVLAAGLHPRVRSQANGSHYTSADELPLIPGIDGVGRMADGQLVYFVLPDTRFGSMADQAVIDTRRSIVVPPGTDPIALAAAMNPAMSSWVALRRRIDFVAGQSVLILGATGNAGQLAVQIAKRAGAGQVIALGRNRTKLEALSAVGADILVPLDSEPDEVAQAVRAATADVDVVIDYLWGRPAVDVMVEVAHGRRDSAQLITWIQIGAVAGPDASIPSAVLRSTNLRVIGSGQGSVPTKHIVAELPELAALVGRGRFDVRATAVPLSRVERAWAESSNERLVLVPGS